MERSSCYSELGNPTFTPRTLRSPSKPDRVYICKINDHDSFVKFFAKGHGSSDAFNYVEMDMGVSEVQRVKEWKRRGGTIIGIKVGDDSMLLDGLS
ncbi:hypothetical protein Tco_1339864 [Tanacetum coccineum]